MPDKCLYIGVMEDRGTDKFYISSVSADAEDFQDFLPYAIFVPMPEKAKTDQVARSTELGILRNKLTSGGATVIIEH